jgi:hypothetical protein
MKPEPSLAGQAGKMCAQIINKAKKANPLKLTPPPKEPSLDDFKSLSLNDLLEMRGKPELPEPPPQGVIKRAQKLVKNVFQPKQP